jgi:AcrR family transcriptional regulator
LSVTAWNSGWAVNRASARPKGRRARHTLEGVGQLHRQAAGLDDGLGAPAHLDDVGVGGVGAEAVARTGQARTAKQERDAVGDTLKSLALRLGGSQPAPYRHFANRKALLAAVAADGFERFRNTLVAAKDEARGSEAFLQTCLAYLEFARANRGVYRLMFASQLLCETDDEALDQTSAAAFDFLLEGVARTAPPQRVRAIAVWIWSTLHGLAMLEAEGLAGGPGERGRQPPRMWSPDDGHLRRPGRLRARLGIRDRAFFSGRA